ncbi:MAG: xanthine dehydrogenase family protein subunit M [Deltaproteobacteria bacterium]|nr:xanthine dehydrogenase family protein subunit M [Deltaproteobacteria bacterium]
MSTELLSPRNPDELWRAMESHPDAVPFAGGTDVFVRLRKGLMAPRALLCLDRIEELKGIEDHGSHLFIGAGTTHSTALAHPLVIQFLPVLAHALRVLGSPPIRNMGTIGGNIVTASPAGDTLPPLYALGAEVELRSREGSRRCPIHEFIIGPGKTILAKNEILSGVRVRKADRYNVHHFEKVGLRNALAIALVSMAALLRISDSGEIQEVSLAWGSVGPTVVRSPEAEQILLGKTLDLRTLENAGAIVRKAVAPIDDVRAGSDYRRQVAGNLLLRLTEYSGEQPCRPESPE